MKVPHITQKHWNDANRAVPVYATFTDICNKAIEIALAEQAIKQPLITAEEARKLEAGAEYYASGEDFWKTCGYLENFPVIFDDGEVIKYRAIKQPEPVEQHAELKAMYEQQVKDGTVDNFVWEFKNGMVDWLPIKGGLGNFIPTNQYRCTPKQTVQKLMKFDPTNGKPNPYPSESNQYRSWHGQDAWLFNPYTGTKRDSRDIGSDPFGMLITDEILPTLNTEQPTCQIRNLDTGELKTMTRGDVISLLNELGVING